MPVIDLLRPIRSCLVWVSFIASCHDVTRLYGLILHVLPNALNHTEHSYSVNLDAA